MNNKANKKKKNNIQKPDGLSAVVSTVVFFVLFGISIYMFSLALNVKEMYLWIIALIDAAIASSVYFGMTGLSFFAKSIYFVQSANDKKSVQKTKYKLNLPWYVFAAPVIILAFIILINVVGSTVFNAKKYANILTIEDKTFAEDIDESLGKESIALMDTDSARMLGDREIGSLTDVVSQFYVSNDYTQIDYLGRPIKVSPLEYGGFFKWQNNRENGTPGYISVDPVNMSASYHKYEGIKYVSSAFFSENAERKIWMKYPTKLIRNIHFEIDEMGKPYYIGTVIDHSICLFGGTVVKGCVILDPVTGDTEYYDTADIPKWVDVVYYGDILCKQYDWAGTLGRGYMNSIISKQGCTRVTSYASDDTDEVNVDFGYVAKDGDIWIYTGITSCSGDRSNLAFLLGNERTGECHKFLVSGADEKSAMTAAEGEVQEKGYVASFPSLINVGGKPTYIMVLKDAGGLVKLYAAVNVEQYNIVTTASSQAACIKQYKKMLGLSSTDYGNADSDVTITISAIRYIDIDGNTYIYLIDTKNNLYRAKAADFEEMLLLKEGDKVRLECAENNIVSFSKAG